MNWTLEVVVVPATDVDRAKAFYAEQLGFNVDHDIEVMEGNRVVQLGGPTGLRPGAPAGRVRHPRGACSARGARS